MSLLHQKMHICNKIYVLIITFHPTRFGAYCAIFRENVWCTKDVIYEKMHRTVSFKTSCSLFCDEKKNANCRRYNPRTRMKLTTHTGLPNIWSSIIVLPSKIFLCYTWAAKIFQKSRSHLKILVARKVTWSEFHTEGSHLLAAKYKI